MCTNLKDKSRDFLLIINGMRIAVPLHSHYVTRMTQMLRNRGLAHGYFLHKVAQRKIAALPSSARNDATGTVPLFIAFFTQRLREARSDLII
jgi:hypothetical protein